MDPGASIASRFNPPAPRRVVRVAGRTVGALFDLRALGPGLGAELRLVRCGTSLGVERIDLPG